MHDVRNVAGKRPCRRAEKRALYKHYQQLFQTNKKKLMNEILEPSVFDVHPTRGDIEQVFGRLFSSASREDNEPIARRDRRADTYYPVSIEEVACAIKLCASSSPGPDGVILDDVKKHDRLLLCVVFNALLYKQVLPTVLKLSRTILLPKSGDLTNAGNWRPITISSIIVRLFHGILARRLLKAISLHTSQQAFQPRDGLSANTAVLDYVISDARQRRKEIHIVSLDVAKAFDSVSHSSIERALRAAGVEEDTIRYITSSYDGSRTTLACGSIRTDEVAVTCGVKQGDPMSPILFNAIMNELINYMPGYIGYPVKDTNCNIMCFADDVVLVASSKAGMDELLSRAMRFFSMRGLRLNASKCKVLSLRKIGKTKKIINDNQTNFVINDCTVAHVTYDCLLKYLGISYSPRGKCRIDTKSFYEAVDKLISSPLKANQKLMLLRVYLLPRYLYEMTMSKMVRKDLTQLDNKVRGAVRRVLRLPHYSPIGFFYATAKDGGLGLLSCATHVPLYTCLRLEGLKMNPDPVVQAFVTTDSYIKQIRCCKTILGELEVSKGAINSFWSNRLYETVYGKGLEQAKGCSISNSFLADLDKRVNVRAFANKIKARLNLLACKGAPANRGDRMCRHCPGRVESVSHIVNACPSAKANIIKRHDKIVQLIKNARCKKGVQVAVEPRIFDNDNRLYKPDLVITDSTSVTICDIAVPWETPRALDSAYDAKVRIYSGDSFLQRIREMYPNKEVVVCAFIVSARGLWVQRNSTLCDILGLGVRWRRLACSVALEQTVSIYRAFMAQF